MASTQLQSLLQQGLTLHRQGRLAEARAIYETVLRHDARQADALTHLGIVALQVEDFAAAVELLGRAIRVNPDAAGAHYNRAVALEKLGRQPEALTGYGKALSLSPKFVEAHNNRGNLLRNLKRLDEAVASFDRALALKPDAAEIWNNRGTTLRQLERLDEALASYDKAVALAPAFAEAHDSRGSTLLDLRRREEALASFDRALALDPKLAQAHNNRGAVLSLLGRLEDAAESHRAAIALKPDLAEAHGNLGIVLVKFGDVDGALASFRTAITLEPDYANAHFNAGTTLLSVGRMAEGWPGHKHRWRALGLEDMQPFPQPPWDGGGPDGSLLVWGEQGLGDELLYGSMVPDLVKAGHDIVWEMEPRLVPLIRRSLPSVTAVPRLTPSDSTTRAPTIAAQISTASLGQYLRPDVASFPAGRGYLRADAARAAEYRRRISGDAKERVIGLSWISAHPDIGAQKSLTLAALAPILKIPGMRFVDLQYGDTAVERAAAERTLGVPVHHLPDLDLTQDLDGLAALISACDVVVTISNTTAHLAAALGVPVWVMLSAGVGKLWYWGHTGESTPWYPSARIFRQPFNRPWDETVAAVAAALPHFSVSGP